MRQIGKTILCEKTLQLINKTLNAGYIDPESGKLIKTERGTPQGSVLSPVISNIVLHELDIYIEKVKEKFEKGTRRGRNLEYVNLSNKKRSIKDPDERKRILEKMRTMRSVDTMDPNFKRILYVRYADDFVILIIGSRTDADNIKTGIKDILFNRCGLDLNTDKTEITNVTEGFKFLGAVCRKVKTHTHVTSHIRNTSAKVTPKLMVFADLDKISKKFLEGKIAVRWENTMRATAVKALVNLDHADILAFFNNKIRGLLNYYSFAGNFSRLS